MGIIAGMALFCDGSSLGNKINFYFTLSVCISWDNNITLEVVPFQTIFHIFNLISLGWKY